MAIAAGRVFNESTLFLALNLTLCLLFVGLLRRSGVAPWGRVTAPSDVTAGRHDLEVSSLRRLSLLAAVFSLAFFVLIAGSGEVRYAYAFFAMFLLLVAALPAGSPRAVFLSVLLLGAAAGAANAIAHQRAAKDPLAARYDAARKLVVALREIAPSNQPVFVLNDFVGQFSAERNIARFAGYPGEVVRAGSIDPGSCTTGTLWQVSTQLREEGGYEVTVTLPPCASFVFEGVDGSLPMRGNTLYRNQYIQYAFPHLVRSKSKWSGRPVVQFGNVVDITIRSPGRLLYFDFARDSWNAR